MDECNYLHRLRVKWPQYFDKDHEFYDENRVYKSCNNVYIVVLLKLEGTITNESRAVSNRSCASYRADKLFVENIIHKLSQEKLDESHMATTSMYSGKYIIYKKGCIVKADGFDPDSEKVKSNGIHYYKTIHPAFYAELHKFGGSAPNRLTYPEFVLSGWFCRWDDSGAMEEKIFLSKSVSTGVHEIYNSDGTVTLRHRTTTKTITT